MTPGGDQLRLSLRFLSGKHQGSEYVLADPTDVVVGRSSDVDLILIEGMVSRRHARFQLEQAVLEVEDLGSTNGTFVNGDRVRRRRLREGDRVAVLSNGGFGGIHEKLLAALGGGLSHGGVDGGHGAVV